MTKYRLVTESGSDLPKEYVEKYNTKIVKRIGEFVLKRGIYKLNKYY